MIILTYMPSEDKFWIGCNKEECEKWFVPRISDQNKKLYESLIGWEKSKSASNAVKNFFGIKEVSYMYFLVSRDLQKCSCEEPHLPFSSQWVYYPFVECEFVEISSPDELLTLAIKKKKLDSFTKDDISRFVLNCRFYNGEIEAPNWLSQNEKMFWWYEQIWCETHAEGKNEFEHLEVFTDLMDFEETDGTPQDLKALICDRYCHFGGSVEGFKNMYIEQYQSRKTHKEIRTQKRKIELISKCRYFKGEAYCFHMGSKRTMPWYWEKEWVDTLAESYTNKLVIEDRFLNLPPFLHSTISVIENKWKNMAKDYNIPYTLLIHLCTRFFENWGGFMHEAEDNFLHWLHDEYLKNS